MSGTIADHTRDLLSFLNLIEWRDPFFNFRALIGQAEGKVISVCGGGGWVHNKGWEHIGKLKVKCLLGVRRRAGSRDFNTGAPTKRIDRTMVTILRCRYQNLSTCRDCPNLAYSP